MREDVVTPATGRRLAQEGLHWEPQVGDWCAVLGGVHIAEGPAGLWLVISASQASGLLGLVEATGRWPVAQVAAHDCIWLPTAGKLKTWLRAHGYRIATGEVSAHLLGAGAPVIHTICRVTRLGEGRPALETEGHNEAEAVASAVLAVLGREAIDASAPRV
ncbi:MAG TPA: hypothetical protein VF120_06140 [Ktedonobacterales bacterium]